MSMKALNYQGCLLEVAPEGWEPSFHMERIPFRGTLGKIKFALGVLRSFFNTQMLLVQTYKNSYYWYLPKMIKIFALLNKFKIQLKQKGEWFSESPRRKLEQLWVEHYDQPVPEKAKQMHDFPMVGVSLREGGRPYPHPSHSK